MLHANQRRRILEDNHAIAVSDEDSSATDSRYHCLHDRGHLQHNEDDEGSDRELRRLPLGYEPSDSDVVCARGKAYWDHKGNRRYRHLIAKATQRYSSSNNKLEKTKIVSEIVDAVHNSNGIFIKKLRRGGPWVQVDDVFAREKIGQSLRDGLATKYRSATKAKKQRRNQAHERFNGDIDRVIHSNRLVSRRISELTQQVKKNGDLASDFSIITLFSRANSDILETIKNDASMLFRFQDASLASNFES